MSVEPKNIPLNDEALEGVSGGYNVADGLARIGQSISNDVNAGKEIAVKFGDPAGGFHGAVLGGVVGAFHGITKELGTGATEAVAGIKQLMR